MEQLSTTECTATTVDPTTVLSMPSPSNESNTEVLSLRNRTITRKHCCETDPEPEKIIQKAKLDEPEKNVMCVDPPTQSKSTNELNYINLIKHILKSITHNNDIQFLQILKDTKSIIAGGFMCEIIGKLKRWNHNVNFRRDIDIFCQNGQEKVFEKFFLNSGMLKFNSTTSIPFAHKETSYFVFPKYVVEPTGSKIVLISVDAEPKNVVNDFDISVCKIYFDGDNVVDMSGGDIEKGEFSIFMNSGEGRYRIQKYVNRGFKCQDEELLTQLSIKEKLAPNEQTIINTKHADQKRKLLCKLDNVLQVVNRPLVNLAPETEKEVLLNITLSCSNKIEDLIEYVRKEM